jgi:hypothetical protein
MKLWRERVRRGAIVAGLLGSLIPLGGGCNFARNQDVEALYQAIGSATIMTVSDNVFGDIGTDFDAIIREPVTTFAQAAWSNYVASRVPNDVELQ